ncbi:MAG: formylmethanofuran dehydrogenase subunit E family protein [Candidatus Bathyarchaeota archaeon]|nr:formylmethanofuran dehydrogenase subunit E family protein [Candidatus Bathyarchaeota archaeon]
MVGRNVPEQRDLLRRAEDFHGHFGPFLVIGVRIGLIGKKHMEGSAFDSVRVKASLPLRVPFSCVVDGIQVSTRCTIGNQRLSVENSEEVYVEFESEGCSERVSIALRKSIFDRLKSQLAGKNFDDRSVRGLAHEVAAARDDALFIVINK